jgi:hypothetical protein
MKPPFTKAIGRRSGLLAASAAFVVLIATTGCGKGRLDVSPVRGKVTYNGHGVPNSTVIFFPVDASDERAAKMRPSADADGSGQFEIKTYVTGDGAPPGKYRVSIIAPMGPPPTSSKDRKADEVVATGGAAVNVPPAIVKKYANVDTAGIEVEVQEGQNDLEPFELKM